LTDLVVGKIFITRCLMKTKNGVCKGVSPEYFGDRDKWAIELFGLDSDFYRCSEKKNIWG